MEKPRSRMDPSDRFCGSDLLALWALVAHSSPRACKTAAGAPASHPDVGQEPCLACVSRS